MHLYYNETMNKVVIIISGLSGTGKTRLGRYFSEKLSIPFLNKDTFKEIMFDEIGWKDREWSKKVGAASYKIMYSVAEEMMRGGISFVLESNFRAEVDGEKLRLLKAKYDYKMVEVMCKANGPVLFDRFKKRAESGERHPGHVDHLCYEEQEKRLLAGKAKPLEVGRLIEIDTTDWNKVSYEEILTSSLMGL